jgi:hypothetical protein
MTLYGLVPHSISGGGRELRSLSFHLRCGMLYLPCSIAEIRSRSSPRSWTSRRHRSATGARHAASKSAARLLVRTSSNSRASHYSRVLFRRHPPLHRWYRRLTRRASDSPSIVLMARGSPSPFRLPSGRASRRSSPPLCVRRDPTRSATQDLALRQPGRFSEGRGFSRGRVSRSPRAGSVQRRPVHLSQSGRHCDKNSFL